MKRAVAFSARELRNSSGTPRQVACWSSSSMGVLPRLQ